MAQPILCGICKNPKMALPKRTKNKKERIYVCVTVGKGKVMPCDGWVYKNNVAT